MQHLFMLSLISRAVRHDILRRISVITSLSVVSGTVDEAVLLSTMLACSLRMGQLCSFHSPKVRSRFQRPVHNS